MDQLLLEIQDYLNNQGVGTTGTDLFISELPATPDDAIGIFEDAGEVPDKYIKEIRRPQVQIMVRNESYPSGKAIIENIFDLFHDQNDSFNFKTGGLDIMRIDAVTEPQQLQPTDESGRYIFVCNFYITIRND
jgi:hypothetical protein